MTIRPHPDWAREAATWPNSRHSRFLRVGNVGWHIQEMGTGPDLLLLHGAGATTHSWRDQMPALFLWEDVRFGAMAPGIRGFEEVHGFITYEDLAFED